jgi:hypothetical protein
MMHKIITRFFVVAFIFGFSIEVDAQFWKKKKKETSKAASKPKPKKDDIQPYGKVVTKEHKTDEGLFKIHKKEDEYLFEIADSLLNREMLMVSRIAKTASGIGFGGGKTGTQVLRWQKNDKKILLRVVSHSVVADSILPIHEAVVNSNFEPILYAFPIKAFSKDSTATVIDVTSFFTEDIKSIGFPASQRKRYLITRLDKERSYIQRLSSYPQNIEIRHVKTYAANKAPSTASTIGAISVEMSNSMVLLPKKPMRRRYFDQRVGWFARGQTDYGLKAQKSKRVTYLDRWRLEVKDEDVEKFKRGELVEPKKQIVYYIDRATPKEWVPYIKQGVEDWQVAFEAAGFKDAIIAKDPPTKEEDPDWSPEDVRYSVVRYLASPIPNANGPHVSDPRSGEILESDINWYHNVMTLLRNWFFIQTAAINPDARKKEFETETMGRLIRFVSSHEVGHTLGLPHNMGSSVAYPVDSLRSATFTKKYGTAPSIMDYARFNYVAQPEDKGVALMPNIGPYDKYSIAWGYKPILNMSAIEEKETLNKWILKHNGDPIYRFGGQQILNNLDPSSQTEDLGDDAMKASTYGIKNLKRILPNLIDWTTEDGDNYDDLASMYRELTNQFNRYIGHVSANVGGVYENFKTAEQEGSVYTYVTKKKQKRAIQFLQDEVFTTPKWLLDTEILNNIQFSGSDVKIRDLQSGALNRVMRPGRIARLLENEALNGSKAYTFMNLMADFRNGIFSELYSRKYIDTYRIKLQTTYINKMASLMNAKKQGSINIGILKLSAIDADVSDLKPIIRGELNRIKKDVNSAIRTAPNIITKYHLQDLAKRVETILDPK